MRKTKVWQMPTYGPKLIGHDGLGELRGPSGKKQHRLAGCLKDGAYFALIGCTYKQNVYDPPDALDTADRRKRMYSREGLSQPDMIYKTLEKLKKPEYRKAFVASQINIGIPFQVASGVDAGDTRRKSWHVAASYFRFNGTWKGAAQDIRESTERQMQGRS